MSVTVTSGAGLLTVWSDTWAVHLLPSRRYWQWGYTPWEGDQSPPTFGLGPLILICWE